jgi:hypothetical protein
MKGALWDVKDHSDEKKKNSMETFLKNPQNYMRL